MFQQELAPLGSLTGSALVALLPLLTIFVLLGGLRWKAHWAGLAALAAAILVAILAFGMPVELSLLAATQGVVYGLFPIMWIVIAAIWLYELTVISGRFEDLRTAFNRVSDDPRIQGIIIAFCFGGLLEALAGFGAPVAITGVMLVSLGFSPMRAAASVLLANTAPVAFGAIAIPIITAGNLTGIDYHEIGAVVGRQTPLLAALRPAAAGPDRRRQARRQADLAARPVGRRQLRHRPVRQLQLHLGRADRHHRLAGRRWPRSSSCCGSGRPGRRGGPRAAARGVADRAGRRRHRSGHRFRRRRLRRRRQTADRRPGADRGRRPDPRPGAHGVPAVPGGHRRVHAGQAVSRR